MTVRCSIFVALLLVGPTTAAADLDLDLQAAALRARLTSSPTDLPSRLRLARVELEAGRPGEALAELAVLDAMAPGHTEDAVVRAQALLANDQAEAALLLLEERLTLEGPIEGLRLRARLLDAQDREEEALRDLEAIVLRGPSLDDELRRGRLLERLGRLREAALAYREGRGRHRDAAILRLAEIRTERAQGHPDRALALLEPLLGARAVAPRLRVLRGELLREAGQTQAAEEALERALRDAERMLARRPSAMALMERGRARLALGRAGALGDLEQALGRAPGLHEARRLLQRARETGQ